MNSILKKVLLAPLMGSLVLGVSACSSKSEEVLPIDVKNRIEQTMGEVFDLTESEDFMLALSEVSTDVKSVKNYDKEMEKIQSLVADDENLKEFVQEAKGFMEEKNDETIKIVGKSTPFVSTFYAYSPSETKVHRVFADPSGFEKKDDGWIPAKNGALGYMDEKGRYVAFSGTSDNLSFNGDGDKITLASLVDEIRHVQSQQTDTYLATEKALEHTLEWLEKNTPNWTEEPVDLEEKQNEILDGLTHPEGMKFKFIGDTSNFTLEVLNEKTTELVRFTSSDNEIRSSIQQEDSPEPESTTAYTLYYEYVDEFLASVENGNEEYATLEETAKLLEENDADPKVKWSVYGSDGDKTLVARKGGAEYKFTDITDIYSGISYGNDQSTDEEANNATVTETGQEPSLNFDDFLGEE